MGRPSRIAIAGVLLVAVGAVVLPSLFPMDREYGYAVSPAVETNAPTDENSSVVPYGRLSAAERRVFDAALANESTVWLEDEVPGEALTAHPDAPSFGDGYTAVSRDGRTYVVTGLVVRENQDVHQFGGPFLVLLGVVCLGTAAAAVAFRRVRLG